MRSPPCSPSRRPPPNGSPRIPTSVEFALADADGQHFWTLPLPRNLQLVGLPLEQQLLVFDPAANALGITTSGSVSSECGLTH